MMAIQKYTDYKLSLKEMIFCNLIVRKSFNQLTNADCYVMAGFSAINKKTAGANASKLLKKDNVEKYIISQTEIAEANLIQKTKWDKEKLVNKFEEIHEKCMQDAEVLDYRGEPTNTYKFDPANAIKALQEIGKVHGHYNSHKEAPAFNLNILQQYFKPTSL